MFLWENGMLNSKQNKYCSVKQRKGRNMKNFLRNMTALIIAVAMNMAALIIVIAMFIAALMVVVAMVALFITVVWMNKMGLN